MWKKIKQILGTQPTTQEKEAEELEFITFTKKDPIDVQFTKNYIAGGGMFFYSENEQEVLKNLKDIFVNQNAEEVICFDEYLQSLLNRLSIKHCKSFNKNADFIFIKCEYLVAFDGSIMLSSHKTKGMNQEELPSNIVIHASPNQFVANVSEALTKLKTAKKDNIPSNITSIRGKSMHDFQVTNNHKNIYLILAETVK
ncbi:MAG: LUD domain-containing protein [Weeksellaceae bacterium]|jgi:hypothetical protein|nr:LUD domain-containing protein [Weeksellaceae bacterium]